MTSQKASQKALQKTKPTVPTTIDRNATLNLLNQTLGNNEQYILTQNKNVGSEKMIVQLRDTAYNPLMSIMVVRQPIDDDSKRRNFKIVMSNTSGATLLTGYLLNDVVGEVYVMII